MILIYLHSVKTYPNDYLEMFTIKICASISNLAFTIGLHNHRSLGLTEYMSVHKIATLNAPEVFWSIQHIFGYTSISSIYPLKFLQENGSRSLAAQLKGRILQLANWPASVFDRLFYEITHPLYHIARPVAITCHHNHNTVV